MTLKLKIVSTATAPEGVALTADLSAGAAIGRGAASEWVLIDPERHVSSVHARVEIEGGSYVIEDHSTNGLYINEERSPLGKGGRRALAAGDQLRIGRYIVEVVAATPPPGATAAPSLAPDASPVHEVAADAEDDPFGLTPSADPLGGEAQGYDRGASPDDFFSPPEPAAPISPIPTEAGEKWWEDDDDLLAPAPEPQSEEAPAATSPVASNDPFAAPSPSPSSSPAPAAPVSGAERPPSSAPASPPSPAGAVSDGAFDVFLDALGVAPPTDREAAARVLGAAFRELMSGALDLLNARSGLRNELRLAATMVRADSNNPLKFSVHVDDALQKLIGGSGAGFMEPVEASREMMADLRAHELAVMAGVEAGVARLLDQLDPDKFDKGSKLKIGPLGGASKDRYREVFQKLKTDLHERSSGVFWRAFSEGYERQAEIARRKARG